MDVSRPYDPSTIAGKVLLITGGANGLGAHMVRHWASLGAHVFIGDIDDKAGEQFVANLRLKWKEQVFGYRRCDVTVWEDQVALFDEANRMSPHGGIDVVVPNAGVLIPDESFNFEAPKLVNGILPKPNTLTLAVNITGATYTTHLALYYLPLNEPGRDRTILLIGSLASLAPLPGQVQYTMSKHAIAGLFRSLRATAFPHGIRVNMLAPYYVAQTAMLKPVVEAVLMSGSAGAACIEDVVDAATRLVADDGIVGRSLIIGPRLKVAPEGEMPIGGEEGRAIWDCYANDYDEVESFRWRYVNMLNAVAAARGWFAWATDVWGILWRK